MLANIGTSELLIIAVIILLFFGSSKLKELARGLGESTKEMKKIQKEISGESTKKTPSKNEDNSNEDE